MNAAETRASSAIADCTPLAVVSRSLTTAEIDTFIRDVSTTSTNIAAASSTIRRRLPDPSPATPSSGPVLMSPSRLAVPGSSQTLTPSRDRPALRSWRVLRHTGGRPPLPELYRSPGGPGAGRARPPERSVVVAPRRQRLAERVRVPERPDQQRHRERARARAQPAGTLRVADLLGQADHDRHAPDAQREQESEPLRVEPHHPQGPGPGHDRPDEVGRPGGECDERRKQHQHSDRPDHDDRPLPAVDEQV